MSDIDLLVMGDWPAEGQASAVKERSGALAGISPLYVYTSTLQKSTRPSISCAASLIRTTFFNFASIRRDNAVNLHLALTCSPHCRRFLQRGCAAATTWKLEYGGCNLPPPRWSHGPTSRDAIFRNSVSHKAVAAILNMETAMAGEGVEHSRPSRPSQGNEEARPF